MNNLDAQLTKAPRESDAIGEPVPAPEQVEDGSWPEVALANSRQSWRKIKNLYKNTGRFQAFHQWPAISHQRVRLPAPAIELID